MLLQDTDRMSVPSSRRSERPLKVLVLSRNYPNNVLTLLGLWVQGLVRQCTTFCDSKVISPIPYCPPIGAWGRDYTRFREVVRREDDDRVEVFHPRFVVPPGHRLHGIEAFTYYLAVLRPVIQLRGHFPFNVIHAHYTYPDGWVAACLGRRFHIPVIITEQNPWKPWMDDYPWVRRQAIWAAKQCEFHVAISRIVREEISSFLDQPAKLRTIPDGIDPSVFKLPDVSTTTRKEQILFVGIIRPVKGVDILLKALRLLADRGYKDRLVLVGESFYPAYRKEYDRIRQMAHDLGLRNRVDFAGAQPAADLVRHMQESKLLVLPSRKESLGMVLAEALACGTPVVATRCGGPEDIVTDDVGVLVPPEDPEALARGIEHVLNRTCEYRRDALRAYAIEKFSWNRISLEYMELYQEAIDRHAARTSRGTAARQLE